MDNPGSSDLSGIEGLQVYDQETFEENVSKKLDDIFEKQKREHDIKRLKNEFKTVSDSLTKAKAGLDKVEESLQSAVNRGITSDRKLQSLLDQQEKYKNEIDSLIKAKLEIASELEEFEKPKKVEVKTEVVENEVSEGDDEAPKQETKREKSIRLGQMTAFGTVIATKSVQEEQSKTNYVNDFIKKEEDTPKTSSKLKEILERGKQKKKEKVKRYDDEWHTDDSDWDYSDKEEPNEDDQVLSAKIVKKKSKKSYNVVDDGDKDIYLERLQEWQDSRSEEAIKLESKYEELDGGLRVPFKIWNSLYHYQKVAVQWMWELHQQDVGGILGDEMGLGKTVQLAAFIASLSYSSKKHRKCRLGPVLIVCPTTGKIFFSSFSNVDLERKKY